MTRRFFSDRRAAWRFMAEQHPMFDRANQETAEAIVDRVVEASRTTITSYDEGNPGSSHLLRVHTGSGTIWVTPTLVFAPDSMVEIDGYETTRGQGGTNYLLPNRETRSASKPSAGSSMVACVGCGIQHPSSTDCPFCG